MTKTAGILYGIGVGPGDPDLITIKAAKILNQVDIVFAAASTKNNHSLAVNIASEHIPDSTAVKMLRFVNYYKMYCTCNVLRMYLVILHCTSGLYFSRIANNNITVNCFRC